MTGLVEFLRARLDEDEQAVREASEGREESEHWRAVERKDKVRGWAIEGEHATAIAEGCLFLPGDVAHIARWDPARVLAEVEAKRRILEEHPHSTANSPDSAYWTDDFGCGTCHVHQHDGGVFGAGWCKTVRLLALPYTDHLDYRQEWKP